MTYQDPNWDGRIPGYRAVRLYPVPPPPGWRKVPPIEWRRDWPVVLFVAGMLAVGGMLRTIKETL